MVTIEHEYTGDIGGLIILSNGVNIYFSEIHQLKTIEEAREVADKIINSLNQ